MLRRNRTFNIFTTSRRAVILGLASTLMVAGPAAAQISQDQAESFTKTLVAELGGIAKDGARSEATRDQAYRQALQSRLGSEAIGKFLLKGIPDGAASPDQLARYNALFPRYIAAAFATQIGGLAERQINVTQSRARGEREVIVRSEIVNSSGIKKASIDWRIRSIKGQPRLLDVLVERSSPLVTKRQEFSSLVKRDGMAALLAHMESVAN